MLNAIIRFSLRHGLLIVACAVMVVGYGLHTLWQLPVDVFPDLGRPRVTIMTDAPGMAPEEVEQLITIPLESLMNGAMDAVTVRSSSGAGLSVVNVEFNWGTDILRARQTVSERMSMMAGQLPAGVTPQLAPVSSMMSQVMIFGLRSETGETSPMQLRTLADRVIVTRLRQVPGVSQVMTIGGQRRQFQVLPDPATMLAVGVTLGEIETALENCDSSVTGGYIDTLGPEEYLVRGLGRIASIDDLGKLVVKIRDGRPVLLRQVATVIEGAMPRRGDASFFVRHGGEKNDVDGHAHVGESAFVGGPAVVMNVTKQPDSDTRRLTVAITAALEELTPTLPPDVRITPDLYQQKAFIDRAVDNVEEALRDGGILVAMVLFLFLMNFRTTLITLTAIPVSIMMTVLVFRWFGLSINTMTLGGLAVAVGELVDDAIVDVENIFRRLRENAKRENPVLAMRVVYDASCEIRHSIVFSTMIIIVVFVPLFALDGMEGRLFVPLGVAYIVSIAMSLVVSLTLTPVMSFWLLPRASAVRRERDSLVLRSLKWVAERLIRFSIRFAAPVLMLATAGAVLAGIALLRLQRDFIPPFDEGVAQIGVLLPPGTSLARTLEVTELVADRLQQIDGVRTILARTGRAEMDEHVIGANMTEFILSFDPDSRRPRAEVLNEIRAAISDREFPGIITSVEQPMAHLISAMLSGVQSQVAIRIFGDDLDRLRHAAEDVRSAIATVPGVTDLMVEQQSQIPQLRIELDRDQLARFGLTPDEVNRFIETAMNGRVVKQLFIDQYACDLFVRLRSEYRDDLETLARLSLELPEGGTAPLGSVAKIYLASGPNMINREQVRRRIVVQCNVSGRGLVDVVHDIQERVEPLRAMLPTGYFVEYGGQFESQQSASRTILLLSGLSLFGVFLILYIMFRSANLSLQVMSAIPMALSGGVVALYVTHQTFSVAAMVGFISLCGIATRNGILLIDHYLHLMRHEGEKFTPEMIVRAGKERLAPALMTAITAGFGLIPLAMSAGQPGREILYPIATVIIGGLVSCTTLEFFVRPALFRTFSARTIEKIFKIDKIDPL